MNSIATAKFSLATTASADSSVLLSSSDKRACMPPIHRELDGCFSRLTKVRRKHSPFPQQLIRRNGLAAGALRQKRATASFCPARVL